MNKKQKLWLQAIGEGAGIGSAIGAAFAALFIINFSITPTMIALWLAVITINIIAWTMPAARKRGLISEKTSKKMVCAGIILLGLAVILGIVFMLLI